MLTGLRDILDGSRPAEEFLYVVDRRVLDELRPGLIAGVTDQNREVFLEERIADRRSDADVGRDAANQ